MKKIIIAILVVLIVCVIAFIAYWAPDMLRFAQGVAEDTKRNTLWAIEQKIKNGDIIFQTSKSSQSKAIQLATHSKYSHMGIIYENGGQYYVYEAIQPVKLTPLSEWIFRGEDSHYVLKRLKNADEVLTEETLNKMKAAGEKYKGKNYDLYFEWSDERIYCSELVWKIYKEATGIEIGALEKISDFDLSNKKVKQKMKERYGENIPMNEKVISPAAMFYSEKLVTVSTDKSFYEDTIFIKETVK